MTEISPHVFIGGDNEASDAQNLLNQGIKYVCVLGKYTEHIHPARLFHCKFQVEDHQGFNLSAHFDDIYDYIDDCLDRGSKVLVHAGNPSGIGSAVALMWLIKAEGMTYNKAWHHLKTVLPTANPNSGFVRQLKDLELQVATANPNFEKTRTFPNAPSKKTKNLATIRQPYEYTNNSVVDTKTPANKFTHTRAPATVHYDVPRHNFTGNATSLAFAPQENKTFTPSPHYPVSGNYYHHPTHDIPHERYVEVKPELTTKFTPKNSLNFYTQNLAHTNATLRSDFQGSYVKHDTTQTLSNRKNIEEQYGTLGKDRAVQSKVWTLKERGQGGDLHRDTNRVITLSHNEIGRGVIERTRQEENWTRKEGQAEEWRKGDGKGIQGWRKRHEGNYGF